MKKKPPKKAGKGPFKTPYAFQPNKSLFSIKNPRKSNKKLPK